MSDQIVVMNAGVIEQIGSPQQVYDESATAFVANFLGKANMLPGTIAAAGDGFATIKLASGQSVRAVSPKALPEGSRVTVIVRPQKRSVASGRTVNTLTGRVTAASYLGGSAVYEIDIGAGTVIRANTSVDGKLLGDGEPVDVGFEPAACALLDAEGNRIT
jgi:ABC-type Fe3+/spermidine/putrescine transport system ATPase subunit